ncbi:MAG: PIN domain-containing protein [Deltaproteobacteria bacterium]|nr:PIN domain-containing protein [Deltaproteobacteria bacterium]
MLNLDTHILIHALNDTLTPREKRVLSKESWSISAIVLWEIYKLHQLKRIVLDIHNSEFVLLLSRIHIWELNFQVFKSLSKLDFKNDPADEIIAATSIAYNCPLVTRDKHILRSKVTPFFR